MTIKPIFLAADTALTSAERTTILQKAPFSTDAPNPLPAILAEMEVMNTFSAALNEMGLHGPQAGKFDGELLRTAARICMALSTALDVTRDDVDKMAERIYPMVGWAEDDLLAEKAKRAKLEVLAPAGLRGCRGWRMPGRHLPSDHRQLRQPQDFAGEHRFGRFQRGEGGRGRRLARQVPGTAQC